MKQPNPNYKTALKQAYLELGQRRAELEAIRREKTEPIAVIGMGCRFPGGADSPEKFWQLLDEGRNAVTEIPADRWDVDAYYDPNPETRGHMATRFGAFIDKVQELDAQFFGISPREARYLDPQQRILLEVSWEAVENANLAPKTLFDSPTGVFIGITCFDHAIRLGRSAENSNCHSGTGSALNMAAGRLSYFLGLKGPCMAVDTACSSSLLSVHLACQSLRLQECATALAGGVHLILSPQVMVSFSQARMLAHDGRCKTFDAGADGYVRGEGCGMLVLKRLSDALARGDRILALIRGSAVNQDGPGSGLTVPNGLSQRAVVAEALQKSEVTAAQIDFVETHGTGTSLGDPIEAEALAAVFGGKRPVGRPLYLGSVKTNIGHLESAAGAASLIKTILALRHRRIPPNLHFKRLNPHLDWSGLPFMVPTSSETWPEHSSARRAGVSSFGFSGTNVHIILEEAPPASLPERSEAAETPQLLCLSAKTSKALKVMATAYARFLERDANADLADVAYNAHGGRAHFPQRLALVAESREMAQRALAAFGSGSGSGSPTLVRGDSSPRVEARPVFLFSGQGSQYAGMGRALYQRFPCFRQTLDRCAKLLDASLPRPLLEVLFAESGQESPLHETVFTQPCLFALEYALAELWQRLGIAPRALVGHSIGELAAACFAGIFSLEDGLALVVARSGLMQKLPQKGAMAAVFTDEAGLRAAIEGQGKELAIAAVNGPRQTVVSGERESLQRLLADLAQKGIQSKLLGVSHAFHSPLMRPMLASFERAARGISYHRSRYKIISSLTGKPSDEEMATAGYWCRQILKTVRFADAVAVLRAERPVSFLEIGPGRQLLAMVKNLPGFARANLHGSLEASRTGPGPLLESLARLYVDGVTVDWELFHQGTTYRNIPLPTYPFQRSRFWIDDPVTPPTSKPAGIAEEQPATEPSSMAGFLRKGDPAALANFLAESGKWPAEVKPSLDIIAAELLRLHRQPPAGEAWESWLYHLKWCEKSESSSLSSPRKPEKSGTGESWLIFSDQSGFGPKLAAYLESLGIRALTVYSEEGPSRGEDGGHRVRPNEAQDFRELLGRLKHEGHPAWTRVLYLWGLDLKAAPNAGRASYQTAEELVYQGLLYLVKALGQDSADRPRLWVVTRDAVPALPSSRLHGLAASPLWGFGKVIGMEFPEMFGGLFDLDPNENEKDAAMLTTSILGAGAEEQFAVRNGVLYMPRLQRSIPPVRSPVRIDSRATYLITGGLGVLGLRVSQWLAAKGARYLILMSRSGVADDKARESVAALERAGVTVAEIRADITRLEDMEAAFLRFGENMPPLKGVIHAAGNPGYEPIETLQGASLAAVLAPKVRGTWLLHLLTREMQLDFFVCFSSIASVWGSKGQAHYTAACQFLDALAAFRQGMGLPATSLNWGPWAGGGMTTPQAETLLRRIGVRTLPPASALAVLERLLASSPTSTAVVRVDWPQFRSSYEARGRRPLLERIDASAGRPAANEPAPTPVPRLDLQRVPASRRRDLLLTHIQAETCAALGFDDPSAVDPGLGFVEMGMDSLLAVELADRLSKNLGHSLPSTLIFEHPNIRELTDHLLQEVLALSPVATTTAQDKNQAAWLGDPLGPHERQKQLERLEHISEKEVEALLLKKIGMF